MQVTAPFVILIHQTRAQDVQSNKEVDLNKKAISVTEVTGSSNLLRAWWLVLS